MGSRYLIGPSRAVVVFIVAPSLNGSLRHKVLPAVPVNWSEFQTDASLSATKGEPCVGIELARWAQFTVRI